MSVSIDYMWLPRTNASKRQREAQTTKKIARQLSAEPAKSLTNVEMARRDWFAPTLDRLVQLLELEDNWDSYGASVPSSQMAFAMLEVLNAVLRPTTPAPQIVPSAEGHFQAEWHMKGVDLEVEVVSPLRVLVRYESHSGSQPWELELSDDLTALNGPIDELTR